MGPITRRHTLLTVAVSAVAAALPAVAVEAAPFDAAGYVKLWRDYGNVVTVARGRGGRCEISIYFPDEAEFPPFEALNRFRTGKHHDPSWKQAVIDFLRAEESADV